MYKIKCSGLSPWGTFNFTKEFDTEKEMNSFKNKMFEKQKKSNGLIKIVIDKI
jgi:hypothetical protein